MNALAIRNELVRGAGGGKGGGRSPVEEKDNLRSVQYAEVLDLICEGEVEGLVNGLKSVYLDKVALQNADNTMNFEGVQFAWTNGTQGQAALPGFNVVQSEVGVGVPVLQPSPVVRSITNAAINKARITIGVPQLSNTNPDNGDVGGASFEFAIDLQSNGGGFVEKYRRTISGKAMTKYQLAIVLDLTGSAPWDIRVRRISPVSPGVNTTNAFNWDSYTEIQTLKLRYPNRVVHGLRVSAQQFSRIPERAYDMLLARIQVPVNYDPITRSYSGAWNGAFKIAWTNNPAWIFYDLVTHKRYGLGEFIDAALVDKWALYTIAQYCDQLVPDGRGGTEPRFTCNVVFQEREEAYKVLQDLAAVFRGISFYSASAVQFAQDAPQTPRMIFANANVEGGQFSYASTSATQRHSQVIVYWNNPGDFFARVPELVTDDDLVAKLGIVTLELNAIGITSRGQAARLGRWALYSEDRETDTVSFVVGEEGAGLGVGQVFEVLDADEAGERLGGRVQAATASAVTLDAPVTLNMGETYTLTIMLADASAPLGYMTEARSVINSAGVHSTLTVAPAFSQAPPAEAMWLLQSNEIKSTLWRCLGVKEQDKGYAVTGVAHDPSKYDFIELGLKLEPRPVSRLSETPVKPANLRFAEVLYADRSNYKSRLTVSWLPGLYATGQRYRLSWRFNLGAWNTLPDITDQTVDISGLEPGTVEVRLRAVNGLGRESVPIDGSYEVVGKFDKPKPIDQYKVIEQPGGIRRHFWRYNDAPIDLKAFEFAYAPGDVRPRFEDMTLLPAKDLLARQAETTEPIGDGYYTFAARAVDAAPRASDVIYYPVLLVANQFAAIEAAFFPHQNGWPGIRTNCYFSKGSLINIGLDTWASMLTWRLAQKWKKTPSSPMSYAQSFDLGTTAPRTLRANQLAAGVTVIELCTSADGVDWSAWIPIPDTAVSARHYQLRWQVAGADPKLYQAQVVFYI